MEMCRFGLVLLVLLCTALLAEAQPLDVAPRYSNFLNQHVYGDMAEAWCTSEIKDREITEGNSNNCKEVNTFIRATKKQVKAVCEKGGKPLGGNIYESTKIFSVVTCKLKSGEKVPDCVYKKGKRDNRNIRIGCDQGWPVHYDEGIVVVG